MLGYKAMHYENPQIEAKLKTPEDVIEEKIAQG